jgi:glycosyltransferase involved in cell wall biosynthesis
MQLVKIAVTYTRLGRGMGGSEYVTEKVLEELRQDHEVVFYSVFPEKFKEGLAEDLVDDVEFRKVDLPFPVFMRDSERLQLLKEKLSDRFIARRVSKDEDEFDAVFFSTKLFSDRDFDTKTLQYVHNPSTGAERRRKKEYLKRGYDFLLDSVFGSSIFNADVNLFNSGYTRSTYTSIDGKVVYPPVKSDFSAEREKVNQAIALGRICRDKELEDAIEIASNTDLDLVIAGRTTETNQDYVEVLREMEKNRDWLTVRTDLPRADLTKEVEKSKIGILCTRNEHFGIAAVEYMKAGSIPMVRNEGGVPDVVGKDRFVFDELEEASRKIEDNLKDINDLQEYVVERGEKFTEKEFRENISETVEDLLE